MPRNSNGNFSLPVGTLVNDGDIIQSSQHNPAMLDIAQSLTNSLSRQANGGMLANLPMGNNRIINMADGIDDGDAVTMRQFAAGQGVPLGVVLDYWGSSTPPGYMWAAGQAISRITYSDLFAVIGTSAGAGDGSTTFNLPDYRGRVSAGRESMVTPATTRLSNFLSSVLGSVFGSQDHTLTEAELPPHSHTVTDPGHDHTIPAFSSVTFATGASIIDIRIGTTIKTGKSTTGISISGGGSSAPHNNVQPTIICNKIIRVQ